MPMQVVVDGLLTHYQRTGNGPRVLMLHGWADRLETFDAIAKPLIEHFEIIRLDLPGFGKTEAPKSVWNLSDYAAFTASFLLKTDVDSLLGIVGHSNGGAIAVHGLATDKLQAEKLVLIAASGVRDAQKLRRSTLKAVTKTGKVVTYWLPQATRQKLQKKLYGKVGSDMLVAPHLQETFKRTVRQDIQADAQLLKLPALLIYGAQDVATSASSVGEVLHSKISGSELVVIPEADHFVHQVAANDVSGRIRAFLT